MSTPSLAAFEYEIGARMGRGDFKGATDVAAACRLAWPTHRTGWLLGSFAALCADDKDSALALIDFCLAKQPLDAQCLLQQAECLLALGRRSEALTAARAAAAGAVGTLDSAVLNAVGQFLVNAREYTDALILYDQAVQSAPRNLSLLAKRSIIHRLLGHFDLAARDRETILSVTPTDAESLKALVDLQPQTPDHNAVTRLQVALEQVPDASVDAAALHFALAKSYEDLRDHAASWHHLGVGNRLERARSDYNGNTDRAVIEQIMAGFPGPEPVLPDSTGERPIFIVGLPRTGTTLVERIIGSHSTVSSAGELPALSQAITVAVRRSAPDRLQSWQGFASSLSQLDAALIAREYLTRSSGQRGGGARFSDKQPTNFFYCALILRAFPHAHIVHVTRHPLAACYAIYKTRFDAGFPFAYDLQELADFYICYRRLMAHWHQVLPGRILDVAYEDIVTTQEPTTHRLLEYLDLPFDAACLDFHRSSAPMTTSASAVQVRQPLYDSSLHQWRHFAAQMAPLRDRLESAGLYID
jgi:Tfp pilus assembly protein PilF